VRKEYRDSLTEFYTVVNQCRNMVQNNKTSANAKFMDILEKELPSKDLDGQTIGVSKNFTLDIKKG
jgi:hypothetical protein